MLGAHLEMAENRGYKVHRRELKGFIGGEVDRLSERHSEQCRGFRNTLKRVLDSY